MKILPTRRSAGVNLALRMRELTLIGINAFLPYKGPYHGMVFVAKCTLDLVRRRFLAVRLKGERSDSSHLR